MNIEQVHKELLDNGINVYRMSSPVDQDPEGNQSLAMTRGMYGETVQEGVKEIIKHYNEKQGRWLGLLEVIQYDENHPDTAHDVKAYKIRYAIT